jgi:hypothetical protein
MEQDLIEIEQEIKQLESDQKKLKDNANDNLDKVLEELFYNIKNRLRI